MHRSYVSKDWIDSFLKNSDESLPSDTVKRFFSIVRIKSGEEVAVFDGLGREVIGVLHKLSNHAAHFQKAHLRTEAPPKKTIILLQAAIDEKKLTETVKRGSEFGIDQFIIFPAAYSEQFCFNKLEKRMARLVSSAQDAARQSERMYISTITMKNSLKEAIDTTNKNGALCLFGDNKSILKLSSLLAEEGPKKSSFFVAVGPEGGFSPDEASLLRASNFYGVLWAPYVLRSELACLGATAIINAFCGRA